MNLENINTKKNSLPVDDLDFDFKPITSGLGFHHQKTTEVRPVITERKLTVSPLSPNTVSSKSETQVYQNDLSLFYGQATLEVAPSVKTEIKEEKTFRLASKPQRFFSYLTDLLFVCSMLGIMMTIMARIISMDLIEAWSLYPHEITPLVVSLFCGFYLLYFSIFEKTNQSTLGKQVFGLRVVSSDNRSLSLNLLLVRSGISLLNFVSLGLFSYFDLQNKATHSKVIRID